MKTIDEILQETSVSLGYFNFNDAVKISSAFHMKIYVEKAMQEYAKQVAEAQRKKCAYENFNPEYGYYKDVLNTQLVTDKI